MFHLNWNIVRLCWARMRLASTWISLITHLWTHMDSLITWYMTEYTKCLLSIHSCSQTSQSFYSVLHLTYTKQIGQLVDRKTQRGTTIEGKIIVIINSCKETFLSNLFNTNLTTQIQGMNRGQRVILHLESWIRLSFFTFGKCYLTWISARCYCTPSSQLA